MEAGSQRLVQHLLALVPCFFPMHLASSKWSPKWRVACIHVREPSELGSL
jgi:hypothetical protein